MSQNNDALVGNAADPKQVKNAKRKEETLHEDELNDVFHIMSSPQGRKFIYSLLVMSKVWHVCFTGNSHTFFNLGQRDIGLKVLNKAESFPELYTKMIKENKKELRNS